MIVSLVKLRQLVTVARCASLTRAAEELNISQPALSRSVAFIEKVYGVQIFDRTPQGVVPTQAGAAIVEEASRLLRSAETFDHNASLIGEGRLGQVSVGMGPAISSLVMAKACMALMSDSRTISIRAHIRRADHLLKSLIAEEVELGLLVDVDLDLSDEFATTKVGVATTALMARKGHPLEHKRRIKIADLREYPIAGPLDINVRPNFRPIAQVIVCDDYKALTEVVRNTDALFLGSRLFARKACEEGGLAVLDVDFPPEEREFDILAVTLKGRTLSPSVNLIIDCCRSVLEQPA